MGPRFRTLLARSLTALVGFLARPAVWLVAGWLLITEALAFARPADAIPVWLTSIGSLLVVAACGAVLLRILLQPGHIEVIPLPPVERPVGEEVVIASAAQRARFAQRRAAAGRAKAAGAQTFEQEAE